MLPHLRRIASCFFFTLAILFAALWARSCWYIETLILDTRTETLSGLAHKDIIRFELLLNSREAKRHPLDTHFQEYTTPPTVSFDNKLLGFHWSESGVRPNAIIITLNVPLWFPVFLFTALLAVAIRPAPRFKFSLHDLFTLTTLAAVTIGPLAFWLRSIS